MHSSAAPFTPPALPCQANKMEGGGRLKTAPTFAEKPPQSKPNPHNLLPAFKRAYNRPLGMNQSNKFFSIF